MVRRRGKGDEYLFYEHFLDFSDNDSRPPNRSDLNPLDYRVCWAMLEKLNKPNTKPQNAAEPKVPLQAIWDNPPDKTIHRSVLRFWKWLAACIKAQGRHFELSIDLAITVHRLNVSVNTAQQLLQYPFPTLIWGA